MTLGNNLVDATTFNSRLQTTFIKLGTTSNPTSVLQLGYEYTATCQTNNNGNVLKQTIAAPGLSLSQSYCYDALNRLSSASENSGANWSQTYGYDRYGNRWVSASTGYTLNSLTPQSQGAFNAANNRLLAGAYDGAGNQTADVQSRTFTYDAENRQTTFNGTSGQYFYDGEGRRVKKIDSSGTTLFVYNAGGQLIAEYTSGSPSGGGTSYLTSDHLGSTRVVTKADGSVKARYDYLPFGEEIPSTVGSRSLVAGYGGADSTRQKFTSKERDTESGLDYFGARYYSSAQGRFTGVDPINLTEERLLDPQQINLYVYTRNDPLNLLDPTGTTIDFDKDKNGNLTKNGKYSQDLYKKYVEFLNKDSKKYASQLQTIAKLEKSDVNYLINVTANELAGSHEAEGRTSTDGTNVLATIRNIGGLRGEKVSIEGRFAHELEHGRQFDEGEFSFLKAANGDWIPDRSSYDIYDEVKAFKAQLDVSPSTADTQLLRQLRDSRITDDQRAKILVSGGYPNRNPVSSNVTMLWNAPPGTLVRPTAAHPNAFGRVHD